MPNAAYHARRVVCMTLVPSWETPHSRLDPEVEGKVVRLIGDLGPSCRVSDTQWLIATNEACGAIVQDLASNGIDNVLVYATRIERGWRFCCKPAGSRDEWEFDGIAAFLQQLD